MNIVTAIKAQLLGQLIETLGKPSAATDLTQSLSANLKVGSQVQARVLGADANGALIIALGNQQINARIEGAQLPASAKLPGAVLTLTVSAGEGEPRFTFVSAAAPRGSIATAAPVTSGMAQPGAARQAAVAEASVQSAARQGSAAPLYADLAAVVARPTGGANLPANVQSLANALLATRLDGEQPITAQAVKAALQASGVLHEANAARSPAPVLDAKLLLTLLKTALETQQVTGNARMEQPSKASAETAFNRPAPPRSDGPVVAHKAVLSALAAEPRAEVVIATLARDVTEASDRLRLHQIASLPEQVQKTEASLAMRQINTEIPVVLAQQTAIAGFRVEQDRRSKTISGEPIDSWGVRFAIDADGVGPVHAHLRLQGAAISVSLWAEEPATHRLFVEALPHLAAALTEGALEVGELMVFSGRPAEPPARKAMGLLDRVS